MEVFKSWKYGGERYEFFLYVESTRILKSVMLSRHFLKYREISILYFF